MTLELKSSAKLLTRLTTGETLMEIVGKWSSWRIEEPSGTGPWKKVIAPPVLELLDAGFIERIDDRAFIGTMGALYECFKYSVTDAGRAWLAAHNAPQESTT